MRGLFFILFCCAVLISCNNNPKPVSLVGNVDTTAIANDTNVQKAIESSYEYAQSLNVSEKLVYDIRAYGGPAAKGMYAIIRRGANNKPDTIVKAERNGIITHAFLADLDNDKQPEIYIATQSVDKNRFGRLIVVRVDSTGKANSFTFEHIFAKTTSFFYRGLDTIYWLDNGRINKKNLIVFDFPAYRRQDSLCCPMAGRVKLQYVLYKNDLEDAGIVTADSTRKMIDTFPFKERP